MQAGANATNALPDAVKGDVLAYTKLLGPGESEIIKFKAPKKPGLLQFVCTFPGHYAMMRGVMVVKWLSLYYNFIDWIISPTAPKTFYYCNRIKYSPQLVVVYDITNWIQYFYK